MPKSTMFQMKYLAALAVVLVLPFSSSAEVYERGNHACDVSMAEEDYRQDPEHLGTQVMYAICLVIKGDDATGLPELYRLADYQNSVTASFFLAEYLETDGRFTSPPSYEHLDEAIKYYYRTQVLIDHIPAYPEPDYFFHERIEQMHLQSVYSPVKLYINKYDAGILGDYRRHLYQSPSNQGDREGELWPQYSTLTRDSLNNALRLARECAGLPKQYYFNSALYRAVIEACQLDAEQAQTLLPLEEKRLGTLLRPRCEDLNETNCPEYYETHQEIYDLRVDYVERIGKVFDLWRQSLAE